MSQIHRADNVLGNVVGAALATALSISLGLPVMAQGMTPVPAQQRKPDTSPAIPPPGSARMGTPAEQVPYSYPTGLPGEKKISGTGQGPKPNLNWFGFLGLFGLSGLLGLRRRHSEGEERAVYRERSRAA